MIAVGDLSRDYSIGITLYFASTRYLVGTNNIDVTQLYVRSRS